MKIKSYQKQHNLKNGLTVVEFMTVFVIIGILVAILSASFFGSSRDRAFDSTVISNIRTLQVMLETYRIDWEAYPSSLNGLGLEATDKNYNKAVTNPYTSKKGPVDPSNIWAIDFIAPPVPAAFAGRVGYQYISSTKYYLVGYGKGGEPIKRKGKIYTMTNGESN